MLNKNTNNHLNSVNRKSVGLPSGSTLYRLLDPYNKYIWKLGSEVISEEEASMIMLQTIHELQSFRFYTKQLLEEKDMMGLYMVALEAAMPQLNGPELLLHSDEHAAIVYLRSEHGKNMTDEEILEMHEEDYKSKEYTIHGMARAIAHLSPDILKTALKDGYNIKGVKG
jgi:hypothetical protein